jgi:Gpi18-like mannosyltransferase
VCFKNTPNLYSVLWNVKFEAWRSRTSLNVTTLHFITFMIVAVCFQSLKIESLCLVLYDTIFIVSDIFIQSKALAKVGPTTAVDKEKENNAGTHTRDYSHV